MSITMALLALLFGGIPFGRLLYTIFGDLPERGGNIPALALWQRGYPRLAVATGIMECLKIWFVYQVLLSLGYMPEVAAQGMALALLGHVFSVWLKFRPSFSVSPFIGVLLACSPLAAGLGLALWWQVWRKSGQLGLAAITTLGCIPLTSYATGDVAITLFTLPLVLLGLVWQSRYIKI